MYFYKTSSAQASSDHTAVLELLDWARKWHWQICKSGCWRRNVIVPTLVMNKIQTKIESKISKSSMLKEKKKTLNTGWFKLRLGDALSD